MARAVKPNATIEVRSREELRSWLAAHHEEGTPVWLVTWKRHTDHYLSVGELIEELLCWGWVDNQSKGVDADRTSVRIAPRNPTSAWSAVNKEKVEKARRSGAMTAAGEAAVAAAEANGMWTFLDDVERLEMPRDLRTALAGSMAVWEAWPRSVRRGTLAWIKTAMTATTRAKRIEDVTRSAAEGQRPAPFRR